MEILTLFLASILLTEALTELIVKSEIALIIKSSIHRFVGEKRFVSWFIELTECGYCTSVWIGLFFAILFFRDIRFVSVYVDWVFIGLVIHRTSNYLHHIVDRIAYYIKK